MEAKGCEEQATGGGEGGASGGSRGSQEAEENVGKGGRDRQVLEEEVLRLRQENENLRACLRASQDCDARFQDQRDSLVCGGGYGSTLDVGSSVGRRDKGERLKRTVKTLEEFIAKQVRWRLIDLVNCSCT